MSNTKKLSIILASLFILNTAQAKSTSDKNLAVTGKLGTLGAGLDLTYGINEKLNVRFNANIANTDIDREEDGIDYEGTLKGQTFGGLIDFHPVGNGFRVSAGLYSNGNELDLDATGANNNNVLIGNRSYDLTGAKLNTKVGFKSIAPYLGLGWGDAVKKQKKWNFSLDAGILFQGAPESKLKATGNAKDIATNTTVNVNTNNVFQTELAKEEKNLDKELEDFKFFPVVSAGVSYRF